MCLAPASAAAAVPSAATSTVDPCIRICPSGDMNFHVLVRDAAGEPVAGSFVDIDFCACPSVVFCPFAGSEPYALFGGCHAVAVTNAAGVADFPLRAAGTCRGVPVTVHADGVLLATHFAVASPDLNGDSIVNATDRIVLLPRLEGPYDPTCDFNCGGTLDPGDRAIFEIHADTVHWCFVTVAAGARTWGWLKTLYR